MSDVDRLWGYQRVPSGWPDRRDLAEAPGFTLADTLRMLKLKSAAVVVIAAVALIAMGERAVAETPVKCAVGQQKYGTSTACKQAVRRFIRAARREVGPMDWAFCIVSLTAGAAARSTTPPTLTGTSTSGPVA
jgi:hypothetical protein